MIKKLPDVFGLSEVNCKKRKGCSLPLLPLKSRIFLIATLIEDIKPVVAVKDDFECRDKRSRSIFWNFRTTKILMQKKSMV